MAIDLKNVNISLDEFQRISSGWYNAGEVKLKNANTLDKVNNHVATWWYDNKDEISHAETVAIKEALVKALSQHGVEGEALNRARQKLGLQPMDPADKSLLKRSVMPLTRQQIREILDENAETLNQSEGHERIRTQAELDARKGDRALEKSTAKRNEINASLASRDEFRVNTEIARFERVVSDFADFASPEERAQLLEVAKKQLNALMVDCHCRPRADHRAIAKLEIEGGQQVTVDTGMNEVEFAERLENFIARLCGGVSGPKADELEVVSRYRACKSRAEQQDFLNALPTEQEFGFKARALAVRCLYSRKVTDYATLSVVNRISDANAYALARSLLDMPGDATPEQLRANPLLVQLMAAAPVKVKNIEQAYIPATSNLMYNKYVRNFMKEAPEDMFPEHRNLAETVKMEVRDRLGAVAMPEKTNLSDLISNEELAGIQPTVGGEERRNTVETIRESFLAAALRDGAIKILDDEMGRAISALGGNLVRLRAAVWGLMERNPLLLRDLTAAQTPDQAQAIVAGVSESIRQMARLYCKVEPLQRNLAERTRQHLAQKLGVSREDIGNEENGVPFRVDQDSQELFSKILSGEVQANTDEEVQAVFTNEMEGAVAELTGRIAEVDQLDPPLAPQVADQVKTVLFSAQNLKYIDIGRIAGNVRDRVSTEHLDQLLRSNADKVQVQNELAAVKANIDAVMREILAGQQDLGPDDWDGIMGIASIIAIRSRPGLADRLDAFFLRPDVRREIAENDDDKPVAVVMDLFREQSFHPDVFAGGPWQAAKMRRLFSAPREMAEFKAAGGEVAALQAGYHAKDMPMLARAFTLVRAARNLTDQAAMDEILDPVSRSRRLFGYGGRFLETPENFRRGLELMERFHDWRTAQGAAYEAGNRNTPTLVNVRANVIHSDSERGLEKFVLEEIAANPVFALDEVDDDKLFAMQHNRAMRFVGLNYASSGYGTLSAIPPAKRGLVYDVVDLLRGPLANTMEEREGQSDMSYTTILLARILKNYDELEELKQEGHLDRAHVIQLLFGDLGVQATDTAGQIDDAIFAAVEAMPPLIGFAASNLMSITGDTAEACRTALEQGQRLPNAPYVVTGSSGLEGIGTAEAARKALLDDLERIQNVGQLPEDDPILNEEQLHFVFRFPGAEPLVSRWSGSPEEVQAANNAIVDKLADLCGRAHPEQFSAACYALSQSGAGANVRSAFTTHNISSSEHMPLTFAITRSNETGAIEIVCSEPAGFPLKFHWTTTVALDGTVTSTPMMIEQPPQQPQLQPVANP